MRFWVAVGVSLICACSSTGESEKPSSAPDSAREPAADGGEPDARAEPADAESGDPAVEAGSEDAAPPRVVPEAGPPEPQPAGASAPEAGPAPDQRITVRGKVIDFWRQPVSGVEVTIGETTARTDDRGVFTIERVTAPYAALAVFSVTYPSSNTREYRWLYQGLERADPTLQVDSSTTSHIARVEASFTGATFPLPPAQRLQYAFGSPHTMWNREPETDEWVEEHVWLGPAATSGTAHALLWTTTGSWPNELPVRFDMHASSALELKDGVRVEPVLALAAQPIENGVLAGRVTAGSLRTGRRNHVFVRWTDNARVKIAADQNGPDEFSYVVPVLDDTTILMAASAGEYVPGPFAVAHRALLPPDQTNVELEIPNPPTLLAPAANVTNVDAQTKFEWRGEPVVHVLVVENGSSAALRVVTTESSAELPRMASGALALDPSTMYAVWVETHGRYASVDEAADAAGFLDDYMSGIPGPRETGEPFGRPRPNGSYTASAARRFQIAP